MRSYFAFSLRDEPREEIDIVINLLHWTLLSFEYQPDNLLSVGFLCFHFNRWR